MIFFISVLVSSLCIQAMSILKHKLKRERERDIYFIRTFGMPILTEDMRGKEYWGYITIIGLI